MFELLHSVMILQSSLQFYAVHVPLQGHIQQYQQNVILMVLGLHEIDALKMI